MEIERKYLIRALPDDYASPQILLSVSAKLMMIIF